jgi:hypothetical protein
VEPYQYEQIAALRDKVARLERTVEFLLQQLKLTYVDEPPPPKYPEVERLLRQGTKSGPLRPTR